MNALFNQKDLNDYRLIQLCEENGFDVYNIGGSFNPDFYSGEIHSFKNNQFQLVGSEQSMLTCSANTFIKTLLNVEKKFNYQLFA